MPNPTPPTAEEQIAEAIEKIPPKVADHIAMLFQIIGMPPSDESRHGAAIAIYETLALHAATGEAEALQAQNELREVLGELAYASSTSYVPPSLLERAKSLLESQSPPNPCPISFSHQPHDYCDGKPDAGQFGANLKSPPVEAGKGEMWGGYQIGKIGDFIVSINSHHGGDAMLARAVFKAMEQSYAQNRKLCEVFKELLETVKPSYDDYSIWISAKAVLESQSRPDEAGKGEWPTQAERAAQQAKEERYEAGLIELATAKKLLSDVYEQVGNHAEASRRHALTSRVRDAIRDFLSTPSPETPAPPQAAFEELSDAVKRAAEHVGINATGIDAVEWVVSRFDELDHIATNLRADSKLIYDARKIADKAIALRNTSTDGGWPADAVKWNQAKEMAWQIVELLKSAPLSGFRPEAEVTPVSDAIQEAVRVRDEEWQGMVEAVRAQLLLSYNDANERLTTERDDYLDARRIALFEAVTMFNKQFPPSRRRGRVTP